MEITSNLSDFFNDSQVRGAAPPDQQGLGLSDISTFFDTPAPRTEPGGQAPKPESVRDFVRSVEPAARRVAQRLGVPLEAVIGQWGLETGWGKSVIPGTNNLGNIKAPRGQGVQATDNMTGSRDDYRRYGSVDEFADDFAGLLGTSRYRGASGARDAQAYFAGLKQGGYAEDPDYVRKGSAAAEMARGHLGQSDAPQPPAWTDIQAKPEFAQLAPEKQAEAKAAYFDYWIRPRAGSDVEELRTQFLGTGAAPAQEPGAAFGVYPRGAQRRAAPTVPTESVLQQPGNFPPAAELPTTSRAPVRPEVRAAFAAEWDAASPQQRQAMAGAPGWVGMLARERAGVFEQADQSPTPTEAKIDPRMEARRARLLDQHPTDDPSFLARAAQEGARYGVTPGQEVQALGRQHGTVQASDFDFELADAMDHKERSNGLNNPVARGLVKAAVGTIKAGAGYGQFLSEVYGLDRAGEAMTHTGGWARDKEDAIGEHGDRLSRNLEGAINSIGQQLPLMIAGVKAGSQVIPLAGMALQSFGQEYSDGRAKGLDPTKAGTRAGMMAAFEVIGERFGLGEQMDALRAAAKGMPSDAIMGLLWSALRKEVPGEVLTTTGQFAVDKFSPMGLNKAATFEDYLQQVGDTITQTVMQSGIMGAGTTGTSAAVRYLRKDDLIARDFDDRARTAKEQALAKWEKLRQAGGGQVEVSAPITPDGRIDPTFDAGSLTTAPTTEQDEPVLAPEAPAPAADPLVDSAQSIVRELAQQAGMPLDTVLPPNQIPPPSLADEARLAELSVQATDDAGLSPELQAEYAALAEQAQQAPTAEIPTTTETEFTDGPQAPEALEAEAQGPQAPAAPAVADAPAPASTLDAAAHEAATSPTNARPEPTDAQKAAGNYAKGHTRYDGLDITVENPEGSTRSGTDPGGQPWQVTMSAHYGYVKRTKGADGDQVDVYVKPGAEEGKPVFVFDQFNADGSFDEHKAVLGYDTAAEAQAVYDAHFSDGTGPQRRRGVTQMTAADFKAWAEGDDTSKPLVPPPPRTEKEARERRTAKAGDLRALAAQFRERHQQTGRDMDRTFAAVIDQLAGQVEQGKRSLASIAEAEARYREMLAQPVAAPVEVAPPSPAPAPQIAQPQQQQQARADGPGRRMRLAAWQANPLRSFLGEHGIKLDLAAEFAPGQAERRKAMVAGFGPIFRKSGKDMDELAQLAVEAGFLAAEDVSEFHALVARAIRGERVAPLFAEGVAEREMEQAAQARYEDFLIQEQAAPADDPFGPLDAEDLEDVGYTDLSAKDQEHIRVLQTSAEALDIDVEGIMESVAAKHQDATQDEYHAAVEQAIHAAIAVARGNQGGRTPDGRASAEAQGPGSRSGEDQGLTSYTADEVVARQDRADAARQADEQRQREAEAAEAQERERREIARRSVAAADTFELGQDPMDSLAGQGGLFDAAPAQQQPQDDLGALFDEVLAEETRPLPKPKTEREAKERRAAKQALTSAAKNTGSGLANAIDGLGALFGGPGKLGSGLSFDEHTYAKAKPLFQAALADMKNAAGDIREAMRTIIRMVLDKFGADAAANMKPYVVRFISDVQSGAITLENHDAAATGNDPQQARAERDAGEQLGQDDVRDVAGGTGPAAGRPVPEAAVGGARPGRGAGVSGAAAPAGGKSGDQPVHRADGGLQSTDGPARDRVEGRSGDDRGQRPDADGRAETGAAPDAVLAARLAAQKAAEPVAVKLGDAGNIKATLPLLMPSQHEDVLRAETRLIKPDGYGMLFTNGTGTGKTYLGLGIIKRMVKTGKGNGLVVVPNDAVMTEWTRSAANLGLKITPLADTNDAGKGVAITTYANLANNLTLADRAIDFFVSDEAHNLMSNAAAEVTAGLKAARAITLHPDGAYARADMIEREAVARLAEIRPRIESLRTIANKDDTMDALRDDYLKEAAALEKEAEKLQAKHRATLDKERARIEASQNETRPRAVFLSATPFAYEKNVEWAQGFLFEYPEVKRTGRYNEPDGYQRFMIEHFGYRMRTGKLTEPDARVDRGLMQRQFNTWLRQQGALSARMLDVDRDYDRKFVLIDGGIGTRIDAALKWLREADGGRYRSFFDAANGKFDYLSRSRLLEAIKAQAAVPYIKAQHALGRKAVVFYDYNEGGGFNPFSFDGDRDKEIEATVYNKETSGFDKVTFKLGEFLDKFNAEFPDLKGEAFARSMSPLLTLKAAFPQAGAYNGLERKATRQQAIDDFNDDAKPEANLLIVQSAANAGWSGHDTSGKSQRVLINLGLPVAPTKAIQQEGRIYRVGQASDALFRYFNTGTLWERSAFASKVARRASTAENLAMGEDARGLLQSFLDAFEATDSYPPSKDEGKGGKALDRALASTMSDFDRAKSFYFGQQKKTARTKAREGADYFATPEPVGLKMVQWLHPEAGDRLLEPSAGHGAIARWFPDNAERTVVEPSMELAGRLQLITDAKLLNEHFEALNIINKFEGIAMNPPFGTAGRTAVDHLAKAYGHLADGGRVVAILPEGPSANEKFDRWFYAQDEKGRMVLKDAHLTASISLPGSVFERAGTNVRTRIVIIDKISDPKVTSTTARLDLGGLETVEDVFDALEHMDFMRARTAKDVAPPSHQGQAPTEKPQAAPSASALANYSFEVKGGKLVTDSPATEVTTKGGKTLLGVFAPDGKMAKSVDAFTWKPAGAPGYFVRMKHVQRPDGDVKFARKDDGYTADDGHAQPQPSERDIEDIRALEALYDAGNPPAGGVGGQDVSAGALHPFGWVQVSELHGLGPIGEAFGKRVVGFTVLPGVLNREFSGFNGVTAPARTGNRIFISREADRPHLAVLGHEMAHQLARTRPDLYAQLVGAIRPYIKAKEYGTEFANSPVARGSYPKGATKEKRDAAIREEFIGEVLSDGFMDPDFWRALGAKNKRLLERVAELVGQLIRKVLQAGGYTKKSEPYLTDYKRVMQIAGEIMAEFGLDPATVAKVADITPKFMATGPGVRATNGAQQPLPMGQGQATPAWDVPAPTRMDGFIAAIQDRHIHLKRVQQAIQSQRQIVEQLDAYQKEELYHGRVAARTQIFMERELRPLLMDMKLKGITMDELEAYLWARHAPERNAQIASINLQLPDGGSGLTNAEAAAYMAGADVLDQNGEVVIKGMQPGQQRLLEALAARVDAINAGTKQVLMQYGLENPGTIAAWEGTYKNYVPLMREDMEGATPIGQGFSVKGSASRRATGSQRKVVDILANLALQREAAITRGEKNRVAQALYGLAIQNPHADFWEADKVPTKKVIDKDTGLVVTVPDPTYKNRDEVLVLRIAGQDRAVMFNARNERAMATVQAIKNLDVQYLNEFVGRVAQVTRYFAAINTQYNPVFGIVNGLRDVQAAALGLSSTRLAGKQAQVLREVPAAMRAIWKIERGGQAGSWGAIYESLRLAGGTTGYREMFRLGKERAEALRKEVAAMDAGALKKSGRYILEFLDHYNTAIENGTRMAAFKVALDMGLSQAEAASIAKNLTVNFNRKGKMGTDANALWAFFNAAVQGTARMHETLTGPAGRRIIMGGVALGVVQALIGAAFMGDDEWAIDVPEFIKSRNFIIPTGGKDYISIPMPLGFNALPNIGRIITEFAQGGFKKPGDNAVRLAAAMLDGVNPLGSATWSQMLMPTIGDPIIALGQNADFTGRPIAKEDANPMRPTPGYTRARDSSSTVARALAKGIDHATGGTGYTPGLLSPTPDQLDYIFGTLTGGAGREFNKAYQTAELLAKGQNVPEYRKPLIGRLYGSTDEDSAVSGRFWHNLKEIGALESEVKGRIKDGISTEAFIKSNPDAKLIKVMNANYRQIAKLRAERHRIEFDEKMAEATRTERLQALDARIVAEMRRVNSMVAEHRKKERGK